MPFQLKLERITVSKANRSESFKFIEFSIRFQFFVLILAESNRHRPNVNSIRIRGRGIKHVIRGRKIGRVFEGKSMFVGQKSTRFSNERNERCEMERNRS